MHWNSLHLWKYEHKSHWTLPVTALNNRTLSSGLFTRIMCFSICNHHSTGIVPIKAGCLFNGFLSYFVFEFLDDCSRQGRLWLPRHLQVRFTKPQYLYTHINKNTIQLGIPHIDAHLIILWSSSFLYSQYNFHYCLITAVALCYYKGKARDYEGFNIVKNNMHLNCTL